METFTNFNTWKGLLFLAVGLLLLYWMLKLVQILAIRFLRRNLLTKKLLHFNGRLLLIFKPIAILLLLLDFIAINYLVHGLFLIVVVASAYRPLRNYISGFFLRIHPLISVGSLINIKGLQGEVKQMLPLGMVLSTESGRSFVEYSAIDQSGFSIASIDTGRYRHTLYLTTNKSKEEVLDALFDNPLLHFQERPSTVTGGLPNTIKLRYTMEAGASNEDFLEFLAENNIEISTTLNIEH
jgi:hypothetical protein